MSKKQKTITILIAEFKANLFNAVNGSGLPAAVIEPILSNIYQEVVNIAAAQLKKDMEEEEENNGGGADK